ncbi:MAG: hypothetical protein HZA48_09315 [Planctomycetes bacterium]|nr:hypothetical protein [Planctomycetota bacterium]
MTNGIEINLTLPSAPQILLDWLKNNPAPEFSGLKFDETSLKVSGKNVNFQLNLPAIPQSLLSAIKKISSVAFTGIRLNNKILEISGKDPMFGSDFTFSYDVCVGNNEATLTRLKAPPMLKPFIKLGIASILGESSRENSYRIEYNKNTGDIKVTF